jgi:hypothetical protein
LFLAGRGEMLVVVVGVEGEAGLPRECRRALWPVRFVGVMWALGRLLRLGWGVSAGLAVAAAAVAYVVFALARSVPAMTVIPAVRAGAFAGRPLRLGWPGGGEAAIAVQGVGLIAFHGSRGPTAIASLAKVVTAYVVLREHRLPVGVGGPRITVTRADVAVYRADTVAGQSVVAVRAVSASQSARRSRGCC